MFRLLRLSCSTLISHPRALSRTSQAGLRRLSNVVTGNAVDIRATLTAELKQAMKARDLVKSTTIRSVLSEVYAADKTASGGLASSAAVVAIVRKATTRRTDAAAEFKQASRPDLAEKEEKEITILQQFLPPLLSEAHIDRVLQEIIVSDAAVAAALEKGSAQRALGQVFKAFYAQVDKSTVDPDLVRQRAQALVADSSSVAA